MEERVSRRGWAGILASLFVWLLSVPVLGMAMRSNEAAFVVLARREPGRAHGNIALLHASAVLWGLGFIGLQLLAPLLLAFTLRAAYRLRTAVCFTISAGCAMLLDGLGLLALLVWMGLTLGVG